jgi:hypothetical protein
MSTFEISDKNAIMAWFDNVPGEVCKAFEERKKSREEKEMQQLLACYAKDHRGFVTQIKEHVLPLINSMKEVHTVHLSHPSTSVTPEDVCTMFSEHVRFTRNMVGEEIAKGLTKFSQNSKYQPATFATTHPTAPSSSATPSTSATPPPYGMSLNYFSEQTPPVHNTTMTIYTVEPVPISTIPPTSVIPGQANIVPPLASTGVRGNAAAGVRYTAPHVPQPPHQSFKRNQL